MTGDRGDATAPDLSVVIVARNDRDRLLECLRSIEGQTVPGVTTEVVVIDDGSSDGSPELVKQLFPAVRVISKAHEGADVSRNRGIEESRGGLIAFIDSDCVAGATWIETMVGALRARPGAVVGGRVVHRGPFLRRVVGLADFGEYQGARPREVRCLPTCNIGFARSTLGDLRFDARVADAGGDTVFTEALRRLGAVLVYEPTVAVEHRPSASLTELLRRAGRYGSSFVRARQIDPELRYAKLVRAGIPGVVAATLGRVAVDWVRLVRHRRAAGFAVWEVPAAALMLALRRLASLPAAVTAVNDRR